MQCSKSTLLRMFKFFLRRLLNKYAALIVSQKHFLPENQGLTVVSIYFEKNKDTNEYKIVHLVTLRLLQYFNLTLIKRCVILVHKSH